MNNKRKEFEERLKKSNLSEEKKERYRKLSWELLRLRIVNGITKVSGWAEKIKPLVVIGENKKIVLNRVTDETHKRVVTNVAVETNILTSLMSDAAVLEPLTCNLIRICSFVTYLPNSECNPQLPELSTMNVLRQLPENVAVGKAKYFEVIFNSDKPEDAYDEILQAHKVKIILYDSTYNPFKLLKARLRQLPSETENKKQNEQAVPAERKQACKKSEKKKPCRDVPQRQY